MILQFRTLPFAAAILGVALATYGCGEKSNKQVKTGPSAGAKVTGDENANANANTDHPQTDQDSAIDPTASLILANYYVEVKSLGIQACKGGIKLKVNANMGKDSNAKLLDIPEGSLDCGLLGKIDLTQILGSASGAAAEPPVVTTKDDIIFLSAIGGGKFTQNPASDPGRPMFPSFIAGDKDNLAKLNLSKPMTVISTLEGGKQAQGTVTLKMLYFNKLYESPYMKKKRPFPKTLDFETTTTGFNGVNKIINMLFDRMEFRISLDPLAIPYISFKGKIADFMEAQKAAGGGAAGGAAGGLGGGLGGLLGGGGAGGGAGGLGGGLFGVLIQGLTKVISIEFEAHLVEQEGLSYKTAAEEDNEEEIGGKKTDED